MATEHRTSRCECHPSCIEAGVPYVGIVHNEFHMTALLERLYTEVLVRFTTSGSNLHEPGLDKLLGKRVCLQEGNNSNEPRPKAKAKAKATPKAKARLSAPSLIASACAPVLT
jgi:hypothetical protein